MHETKEQDNNQYFIMLDIEDRSIEKYLQNILQNGVFREKKERENKINKINKIDTYWKDCVTDYRKELMMNIKKKKQKKAIMKIYTILSFNYYKN